MRRVIPAIVVVALLVLLSACVPNTALRQAKVAEQHREWDKAVVLYAQALERNPRSVDIRLRLETAKRIASREHISKARELWDKKQYEDSLLEYRTAADLDPLNREAIFEFSQKIDFIEKMQQKQREKEEWERLKAAEQEAIEQEAEQKPTIDINGTQLQSFRFQNREIGEIYQALAKLAGINIIYHETARKSLKQKTDFIIQKATFWDAFDYFVTTNNHFYRVINDNTLLILDGSASNRRNFEDKAVKVYYLSNADAREVFMMLRTVLRLPNIQQNKEQNAIVVKDTPQKLAMVAKIINILDKAKAEVIIDVEIIEVDSTLLDNIGVLLSNYSLTQTFINMNSPYVDNKSAVRFDDFRAINKTNLYLTIPDVAYHFLKTSSHAKLLAKPQLRITEDEESTLHIGERVPVRKTTFNPNQAAGIGIPVDAFEYESVGIKFKMKPHVHHNAEVSLEMEIDISAIGAGATSTNPSFTTRNIKSKIRLRDGETNLLAGLIREEEKITMEGIAGLADIPIIGRLFSKTQRDGRKTDIIITITPHIVRGAQISLEDLQAIKIGPDINSGFEGTISLEELENWRYLRGVPLMGRGSGGSEPAYYDESDFQEEEEYYYEEEEEEEPGRP
jgi:general secretion pathway protein D